jgi:hypothetical protein
MNWINDNIIITLMYFGIYQAQEEKVNEYGK